MRVDGLDVALVSMPFGPLFSPSIGLSLLKSGLTRAGFSSRVHYFTIDFAERVGSQFYLGVADGHRPALRNLPGEWIFSRALFGGSDEEEREYVETLLRRKPGKTSAARRVLSNSVIERVLRARGIAGAFLDRCAEKVLRESPRIVGFTSVFQQHTASLALAQRIKAVSPDTFIVIGGANAESTMGAETVRQFDFVDAAVSGEGDLLLPELVRRVLAGQSVDGMPGVRTRNTVAAEFAANHFSNAPTVFQMDDLPYPEYDDFFEQFGASRFDRTWQPRIFFETSRGCWWGEKMHCTFCGLNGATMKFRSKSSQRAIDELLYLTDRFEGCDVEVTDNILDLAYFKDFVPALAGLDRHVELFYETKANLRKDQVRMLRDAGIRGIQPGIESLSDSVLKLMRKGITALQNIQLLKWCKELGVEPRWNMLWGFPGESPEEYARMASIVPLLSHLPPPKYSSIRLDRFSPNFNDAEKLGFTDVQPMEAYAHVYRLPPEAVRNLAYHFDFEYQEPRDVASYVRPLSDALRAWQRVSPMSDLFSIDTGDHLIVWDLRPVAVQALNVLTGGERLLYLACDAVTDARQLAAVLQRSPEEVTSQLEPLVARGLVLQDGNRYLALAVALGDYSPAQPVVERFNTLVRDLGTPSRRGIAIRWTGIARRRREAPPRLPRLKQRPLTTVRFKVDGSHVVIQ